VVAGAALKSAACHCGARRNRGDSPPNAVEMAKGGRMNALKKVPIWLWFVAGLGLLLLFGETRISVGNVSVNGQSLGGFSTESKE
jgi:hypothetical protein